MKTYNIKRSKSAFYIHKDRFNLMLKNRCIHSIVSISNHFVDRFIQRNEDEEFHLNSYKAFKVLADNVCKYLYEFEIGNKPTLKYKDINIEMLYNGDKIVLTTIYRRELR
jgi:hypothetical protein